jgi:hypothetical protein
MTDAGSASALFVWKLNNAAIRHGWRETATGLMKKPWWKRNIKVVHQISDTYFEIVHHS